MWKLVIFVVCTLCTNFGLCSFLNYVNMEKLYTLEEELITISDLILNQEKSLHGAEDIHNIYDLESTIEEVKQIHREIINNKNMTKYIVHPIDMYHMTKRLVRDWSSVVKTLDESKSCANAMKVKVQNIADNIPSEVHLTKVSKGILKIQSLYDISAEDIMTNTIRGKMSQTPLSLDDAFDMARVAIGNDKHYLAIDWLKYVTSHYNKEKASFSVTNALNLLSFSYFKVQRPNDALATIDGVLKIDPENAGAVRNRKYIMERRKKDQKDQELTKTKPKGKKARLVHQLCGNDFEMDPKKQSRLFCTYIGERNQQMFDKPKIQTEVVSLRPFIVLFHNMTTRSQQQAVAYLGYEQMRTIMYKRTYSHPEGMEGLKVRDSTHWQWVPNMQRKLGRIRITNLTPSPAEMMVKNIGMDGYSEPKLTPADKNLLGKFFVFLSGVDPPGGDIVFPFANTKVAPQLGSVLFFESKANNQMTVCPVFGGSEWLGVYPLYDNTRRNICHADPIYRPKLK